ncbi:hypothetical protein C0989_008903 [Termitomyces sp. Mn162]|nr:hypothetical protein C0989_008903 [Termitomyces sp. Mn162]
MAVLSREEVIVGILALQGAFVEHQAMLKKLSLKQKIVVAQVRSVEDLNRCDALIIPGGESTTIAVLARVSDLLEPLRQFVKTKPVWGTCAGAILLSQTVEGTKKGGQEILGGISIAIARNGWGSQVESFEADLDVVGLRNSDKPFKGVFIRAPASPVHKTDLTLTLTTADNRSCWGLLLGPMMLPSKWLLAFIPVFYLHHFLRWTRTTPRLLLRCVRDVTS